MIPQELAVLAGAQKGISLQTLSPDDSINFFTHVSSH